MWPRTWGREMSEQRLTVWVAPERGGERTASSDNFLPGLSFLAIPALASEGCLQLTKLPVFPSDRAGRRVRTNSH